jgi:aminoglycoside phosphotransferase (APT) family kinase protein
MTHSSPYPYLENRLQHFAPGGKLLRAWSLTGGVSAEVTALEIRLPGGQTQKVIVRRHGERDRARNPHIAADEFRLMQIVHAAGIPAPAPVFVDPDAEIFETPCVVLQFVEGQTDFTPANLPDTLAQVAKALTSIHQVSAANVNLSFLPERADSLAAKLAKPLADGASPYERSLRPIVASFLPLPELNPPALLHGDYWPGNWLWNAGKLAAVIDWEDAMVGDPLSDLSSTRLEVLLAFGHDAMQTFTDGYHTLMPHLDFSQLPKWDLIAALRPANQFPAWASGWAEYGRADMTAQTMLEAHNAFVAQALQNLPA